MVWDPAHEDLERHLDMGLHPVLYRNTCWVDCFACKGAQRCGVAPVYEGVYKVELEFHRRVVSYSGWAMQRTLRLPTREPSVPFAPPGAAAPSPQAAAVTCHDLVRLDGSAHLICRKLPHDGQELRPDFERVPEVAVRAV